MTVTAQQVARGIEVVAQIARTEQKIMPVAMFIAGWVPGLASGLALIEMAQPWIDKAVAAAPQVEAAVNSAAPIFDAINASAPEVLCHVKNAISVLRSVPVQAVSDFEALTALAPLALGRTWTADEEARWFERASGQQTNQF